MSIDFYHIKKYVTRGICFININIKKFIVFIILETNISIMNIYCYHINKKIHYARYSFY